MRRALALLSFRRMACVWFGAAALGLAGGDPRAAACRAKIEQIELDMAKPGAVYRFSLAEINAYGREELAALFPAGLRSPILELFAGGARGSALIDFFAIRQSSATGSPTRSDPGWIAKLLSGERPIRVTIESKTAQGRAIVYLRRLEISGIAANGVVLDFLVENFFRPLYPNAHINEWFEIGHNVDRVEVRPDSVTVYIGAIPPVRR